MAWTNERVAKLKRLWSEGLSASQIAAQLGGVSRNAVIGKVHKLNLPGRSRGPHIETRSIAARSPTTNQHRQEVNNEDRARVPMFKRLALSELTERACKWPIGDPMTDDFDFCGLDTLDSTPYCSYHAKLAYQPVKDRQSPSSGSGDEILPLSQFANVVGLKKVR
ncbi:GcrA family cell cycle regulator [Agrobacterium tumefaciens]|uniref:GcrA family cell cycle regulator n=1 Tax=Agrobacterium tumefaciens TaxID=358 RepID=UPI001CBE1B4E